MRKLIFIILSLIVLSTLILLYVLGVLNVFFIDSFFFKWYPFLFFGGHTAINTFYFLFLIIFSLVIVYMIMYLYSVIIKPSKVMDATNYEVFLKQGDAEEGYEDFYINVNNMIEDINSADTMGELLTFGLKWGEKISNSKKGSIYIKSGNDIFSLYDSFGHKNPLTKHEIPFGKKITGRTASIGNFLIVEDVNSYTFYDFPYKDEYISNFFISFPIFYNNKAIAVYNFTDNHEKYYSLAEIEGLKILHNLITMKVKFIQLKKGKK